MKAFEEWWKKIKPQIDLNTYDGNEDEIRKAIARCNWRAALEWVKTLGSKVEKGIFIEIAELINEELKDE